MTIGYRQAKLSDIPGIVNAHQEAFPKFFMTALGTRFLGVYYRRILDYPDHVFWIKEGPEGLEGFVSGFLDPVEFYKQMRRNRFHYLIPILHQVLLHPRMILRLFASYAEMWRAIREEEPGTCELSSIAVIPRFGRRGVGNGLANVFIESVRGKAHFILLTTDAVANDDVNRFYLKLGFVLDASYKRSKGRVMNKYRFPLTPH